MTAEHAESYNVADLAIANEKPAERRRAIIASAIGNFLELFDFAIYGFLAIPLGAHFFPSTDPFISLLSSFATFGVGFIMRPVGAVVIGIYGDRKGRKAALSLTIVMMASATGVVGFLPSYASIGIAAPILLVLCRMVQGFATGGEWGGAAAFLVEHSPDQPSADRQSPGRRSWLRAGSGPDVFVHSFRLHVLGLANPVPHRISGRTAGILSTYPRRRYADLPPGGCRKTRRTHSAENSFYAIRTAHPGSDADQHHRDHNKLHVYNLLDELRHPAAASAR